MRVIRLLIYESENPAHLEQQLEHSLPDGRWEHLNDPTITVLTLHSDIEHEKIGTDRRDVLWEGPYKKAVT